MEEFKGTPGPWHVSNEGCLLIRDNSEMGIVAKYVGYSFDYEELANANLIAAAPELLVALQDFMSASSGNTQSCGHDFECICRFDKAKAAIAKALGK